MRTIVAVLYNFEITEKSEGIKLMTFLNYMTFVVFAQTTCDYGLRLECNFKLIHVKYNGQPAGSDG